MTKEEFVEALYDALRNKGCYEIDISPAFFGVKADVTYREPNGRKRDARAWPEYRWGREIIRLEQRGDWIDELEYLDMIWDD